MTVEQFVKEFPGHGVKQSTLRTWASRGKVPSGAIDKERARERMPAPITVPVVTDGEQTGTDGVDGAVMIPVGVFRCSCERCR